MGLEIERKYLLSALPACCRNGATIRQGYLVTGSPNVRIRETKQSVLEYTLTRKSGCGLIRTEDEVTIPRAAFIALWPLTEGARIEKVRYRIRGNDAAVWEIDAYKGALVGLVTAEVEFVDPACPPPMLPAIAELVKRDVTEDVAFTNSMLAVNGLPPAFRI